MIKRNFKLYFLSGSLLIWGLFGLSSCKKENNNTPQDGFDTFNRKEMLLNLVDGFIFPQGDLLINQADSLSNAFLMFEKTLSEPDLISVQSLWKRTLLNWKKYECLKIGPLGESQIARLAAIDYSSAYPEEFQQNGNGVELEKTFQTISDTAQINNAYISNLSAKLKGFYSLEYLLFDKSGANNIVINRFKETSNNLGTKRKLYARYCIANLLNQLTNTHFDWQSYKTTFINADGRDINSSIGLLTNQLIFMVEMLKNEKTGRVLGKKTAGNPQPNSIEAIRSNLTKEILTNNLYGIESLFLGRNLQGQDKMGYDDLLNHLGAKYGEENLSEMIKKQFTATYKSINDIQSPLDVTLANNPDELEKVYNELKKLTVLLKIDMVTHLGIVITYLDNDGD